MKKRMKDANRTGKIERTCRFFISVFRLCQACKPGTENHPLCGWKINGYTNKKITIRFI